MKHIIYIWILVTTLSASASVFAQTNFNVEKMDRLFDALEANNRMMGAVTLTERGKVIYRRQLGFSDLSNGKNSKTDRNTAFRIGSITKVYTAVMIWQLIEEGRLSLDSKLAEFFPNIPNAAQITVADLLAHTSGLPDYTLGASNDPADPHAWLFKRQTNAEIIGRIAGSKPVFAPGDNRQYNNSNYALLGYIIEAVTKSTYGAQLNERIIKKLKLKRTRYDGRIEARKNEAFSYVYEDGKWNKSYEQTLSAAGGAGGIVSTADETAKFIIALANGKLISRVSYAKVIVPFDAKFPDSHLGIASFTLRGINKQAISKQGGIDAFASDVVYVPEDEFAFALVINGVNYPKSKIFWSVMDIYYNRPVEIPSFKPLTLAPGALATYEGEYALKGAAMKITIKRNGSALSGQATGQEAFALEAISENAFTNQPSGIIIEFKKDADGNILNFTLYQGRNTSVWEKEKL